MQEQIKHVLFLCVANSARSQMAEGIARILFPADVQISSAGSKPGKVNPLAIAVLQEKNIDITKHFSKGLNDIEQDTVDLVITLCAEEVCPLFPGKVIKLHWPLPDPAVIQGTEEEQLQKFREVRDELFHRLTEFSKKHC